MKSFCTFLILVVLANPAFGQQQLSGFEGAGILRTELRGIRAATLDRMRSQLVAPKQGTSTPPGEGADASTTADAVVNDLMAAAPTERIGRILIAYGARRAALLAATPQTPKTDLPKAETSSGVLKPDEKILQAWVDGDLSAEDAAEAMASSVWQMCRVPENGDVAVRQEQIEIDAVMALSNAWVGILHEQAVSDMQEKYLELADSGVVDITTIQQRVGGEGERFRSLATVNNLLPVPADVNEPFVSKVVLGESPMGQAEYFRLLGSDSSKSKENTSVRFKEMAWFGAVFNTSSVQPSTYNPATINLNSSKVQGAGQTQFLGSNRTETLNLNLAFDAQNRRLFGEDIHGQLYVEGINYNENSELKFDDLFVRGWDKGNWSLLVGKTDSLFEAEGSLQPLSLDGGGTLTGTPVYREGSTTSNRSQLKLSYNSGPDSWHLAIEDPVQNQWKVAGVQELTRWPALTTKLKTSGEVLPGKVMSLQLSGLIRTIDGETAGLREYHDWAWGAGAFASLSQDGLPTFFAGVSGGRGVGAYINGVSATAAGNLAADSFISLGSLGAYLGAQHQLFEIGDDSSGYRSVMTSIGYGIAMTENSTWLAQDQMNRTVQQGVVNLILPLSEHLITGLEYQYAGREVFTGNNGENHQIMAIVAIQGNKKGKAAIDAAKQSRRAALIAEQFNSRGARSLSAAEVERRSGGDRVPAYQQSL